MKQKDILAQLLTFGLDISPTSLSRLEGQHRFVQDYEVVAVAKALEVSVGELLGRACKDPFNRLKICNPQHLIKTLSAFTISTKSKINSTSK